jgi:8-oxo-dGTP diphosphatase
MTFLSGGRVGEVEAGRGRARARRGEAGTCGSVLGGGILERDETFEEGVVREVAEETGVTVEVERLTGVYKNMTRGIVALVYRCHPTAGAPYPTTESVAIEWIAPGDVAERMIPAYAIRVLDALAPSPASRAHDGIEVLQS